MSGQVRFGTFEFDPERRELRKHGLRIRVADQSLQILAVLLERPGETVTREHIQSLLWPDGTMVGFERSINAAVTRLREALGDTAAKSCFIERVPRQGYCFIAPVERLPGEESKFSGATLQQSGSVARTAPHRRGKLWWAAFGFLLAVALGLGAWFGVWRAVPGPAVRVSLIAAQPGSQWGPALSPDGKEVAFVWDGEKRGSYDIYVQLVGDANPRRLTSDPAFEYSPAWSPDALHIAFLRETAQGTDLLIIPSAGGAEQRLHTSAAHCRFNLRTAATLFCGIAWSPDGKCLAFVDKESPRAPNSIFLLDIESRERRKITTPPAGWFGDGLSAFSPDGRTLAFIRTKATYPSDIFALSLSPSAQPTGEPRRVTNDGDFISGFAWSADGRSLVFASRRGGTAALWRVAHAGGEPERLQVGGSRANWPSVARRGHRLAYTEGILDVNIWRVPLAAAGVSADATAPARLTHALQADFQASISPDGNRIAFASDRSGNFEIWTCGADGLSPRRLTYFNGALGSPTWSPDGRQIAFWGWRQLGQQRKVKIYAVEADGGTPRRLTTDDSVETWPSWSRNGKWIYFVSDRGTGEQVWKVPSQGGPQVQVTRKGGFRPVESADGKSVFFRRGGSVWRITAEGGEEAPVVKLGPRDLWQVSESGIYILNKDARPGPALELFRFGTLAQSHVLKLPGEAAPWGHGSFAISPDRSWLVYENMDREEESVMLVENFR